MKKIGLQIKRVSAGAGAMLTINEGEWTRKVIDIREILKLYDTSEEGKFVTFLSFSADGAYITILRPISGREGDNTAAWIFIPNNIQVDGDTILDLVRDVKRELSQPKRNDDALQQLFSKEYPATYSAAYLPSSEEKVYARRKGPFYPLKDLLGEKRYQPYYSKYSAILIESDDSMRVIDPNVQDISNSFLEETAVLCPPTPQDLKGLYTVCIITKDRRRIPFRAPIRVKKGENINLVFERAGFQPINHSVTVAEDTQICSLPPIMNPRVVIGRDRFVFTAVNDNTNLSHKAQIVINNIVLPANKTIELREAEAKRAHVRISVPGYKEEENTIDLINTPKVQVRLHRAERQQNWRIELTDGSLAEISIKSKGLPQVQRESPIKGYSANGNELEYSAGYKDKAIGFGAACAIFLIVWGCVALYSWYDSHNFKWHLGWPLLEVVDKSAEGATDQNSDAYDGDTGTGTDASGDTQSGAQASGAQPSVIAAIAYLENNDKWDRDSLIQYQELNGLFEEMNSYQFDKILARKNTLGQSHKFTLLLNTIEVNKSKKFPGTFTEGGDHEITVQRYLDKLNRDEIVPKNPGNTNQPKAGDGASSKKGKTGSESQGKPGKSGNSSKSGSQNASSNSNSNSGKSRGQL